jgi:ketosteroid isomerase-like protein
MKYFLSAGLILLTAIFFSWKNPFRNDKKELIDTERSFSASCMQNGLKAAFLAFGDDSMVLLRRNSEPLKAAMAKDHLTKTDFGPNILSWEPLDADISSSGDLGYTYGIYTVHLSDSVMQGTYATVWKKNKNGEWKFVLDVGNEGLSKK